jgi:hypothetical protein
MDWLVPPHSVRILILAVYTSGNRTVSRPVASSAVTSW